MMLDICTLLFYYQFLILQRSCVSRLHTHIGEDLYLTGVLSKETSEGVRSHQVDVQKGHDKNNCKPGCDQMRLCIRRGD